MELTPQQIQRMIDTSLKKFKEGNRSFDRKLTIRVRTIVDKYSPMSNSSSRVGFYSTPTVAQQTVTGSRGANAALASVLTALANLGLIIDSSS